MQTSDLQGATCAQLGPGVVTLVVELRTEAGMPLAKVAAHLLRTTFGLHVTTGRPLHLQYPTPRRPTRQVRNAPMMVPGETDWRAGAFRS